MDKPEPQDEHRWLTRLVGEWTFEGEALMGPGQPPEKFGGRESVSALGELWILNQGEGAVPGGDSKSTSLMTLGYDPQKKRFVGTFMGTMMTNLWVYEGTLAGNVLTLETEGPSMSGDGTLSKYVDTITIVNDDERTMTSRALGEDGTWTEFMKMTVRRTSGAVGS